LPFKIGLSTTGCRKQAVFGFGLSEGRSHTDCSGYKLGALLRQINLKQTLPRRGAPT